MISRMIKFYVKYILIATILLLPVASQANVLDYIEGRYYISKQDVKDQEDWEKGEAQHQCDKNPWQLTLENDGTKLRYEEVMPEAPTIPLFITKIGVNYIKVGCDRDHPKADCNEWDWYILFKTRDKFVWIRDDWVDENGKITGSTVPRHRCTDFDS